MQPGRKDEMSRSGYSDSYDYDQNWSRICYRGAIKSAFRGKRGQDFFCKMITALDAMPVKELIAKDLQKPSGAVCALGAVGIFAEIDMTALDPEDIESVAHAFGIATAMAREIVFENDEAVYCDESPSQRWHRMRNWAGGQLVDLP